MIAPMADALREHMRAQQQSVAWHVRSLALATQCQEAMDEQDAG